MIEFAVAKADITPKKPVFLSGYGRRSKKSEGVLDPIYMKIALFRGTENRKRPLLLITLDVAGGDHSFTKGIKEALTSRFDVRSEEVLINFSHTHASIYITGEDPHDRRTYSIDQDGWYTDKNEVNYEEDVAYFRRLRKIVLELTTECMENVKPCRIEYRSGPTDSIISRRKMTLDGMQWLPNKEAEIDRVLRVLKVVDNEGHTQAVLMHTGCHPTCMGPKNLMISAEFVGRACDVLEEEYPNSIGMFMQGCAAEIKPMATVDGERFRGTDAAGMRRAGEALAEEAKLILEQADYEDISGQLSATESKFTLRTDILDTSVFQLMADDPTKGAYQQSAAQRLLQTIADGTAPSTLASSMTVWHFGDQLDVVAMENEIPSSIGLWICRMLHDRHVVVLGYTNGVYTYIPTRTMLEEGGYEAEAFFAWGLRGPFLPETEDILLGNTARLALC